MCRKARPIGHGPAASAVAVWRFGSAQVVGDAEPSSRGVNFDEISKWLRRGEVGESTSEACARGFKEFRQKPSLFEPDGIIANDNGQTLDNRGIAGELILRRADKLKNRFGDDVRVGRFAGFDLFLRPGFNNTVEVVVRGKNSYGARVTDTALGTIRSLEATVQGFEERAGKLETDIADAHKRAKELEGKVGAHFEHEERYQHLSRRQNEIEEKLDLTKNQAPSQVEADSTDEGTQKISENQTPTEPARHARRTAMRI
jgi:hypothetical protein